MPDSTHDPSGKRTSGRWLVWATAAAIAAAVLPWALLTKAGAGTPGCPDAGRFLILGQAPLLDTTGGLEAVVVEGRKMSIDNLCAPVKVKTMGRRRVSAVWPACAGAAGKARLQAKFSPDCDAMIGTFVVRKSSIKKTFSARLSYCGDGVLDPNGPEQCDVGIPCDAGRHCVLTCRCLLDDEPPGSTSTTSTTTLRPTSTTVGTTTTSGSPSTSTSTSTTSTTTVPTTTTTSTSSTSTSRPPTTTTTTTSSTSTSRPPTTTSTSTSTTSTSTTTRPPTTTSTTTTSSTTTSIPAPVSLSANVQPIFNSRCAIPACHTGAFPAQGLDLRAGASYGALVDVLSTQCTSTERVDPGDPSESYLVWKIQNSGPCFVGTRMPPASALPAASISTIVNWITQGALNN